MTPHVMIGDAVYSKVATPSNIAIGRGGLMVAQLFKIHQIFYRDLIHCRLPRRW
jgi:hypothetical protein